MPSSIGLALLVVAPFIGCADELGAEVFETTRVEGVVHAGRQRLASGFIEFFPREGTKGNLRAAPIKADGTFVAERVPVGKLIVGIATPDLKILPTALGKMPYQRFMGFNSPIERVIPPGPLTHLDLDLSIEGTKVLEKQLLNK
jgi:hypothetical protein